MRGISALSLVCLTILSASAAQVDDWPFYGHDAGGMRYSPLAQINRANVSELKVAWTFHTEDISDGSGNRKRSGFETTGEELWKAQLPASGAATPMTYQTRSGGKQFLVIAAGGHAKVREEPQSDAVVAFALP